MRGGHGLTAAQVAELVGGKLLSGSGDLVVHGVASLERAGPHDITFFASARYLPRLQATNAGAVLLSPDFRDVAAGPATRIMVGDALQAVSRVIDTLHPRPRPMWGVHPSAHIGVGSRWNERVAIGAGAVLGRDVRLGAGCIVEAYAVIENGVVAGDQCRIGCHAVVHQGSQLGHRVVVKPGTRIGGQGFAFAGGRHGPDRVPHIGACVLENDVEVGANSTIDCGRLEPTVIGAGTKIDNLVHIGHNVRLGKHCIVMAQVGIAGSAVVGDGVILAGQAGLADHVRVGAKARVAAQSGVIGDIASGATVSGYPARSHRAVLRQVAALGRLTPLVDSLERLAGSHEQS